MRAKGSRHKRIRIRRVVLKYCVVTLANGEEEIQLYVESGNRHLVLLQSPLPEVLKELTKLRGIVAREAPKLMGSCQRAAAVEEIERMLEL